MLSVADLLPLACTSDLVEGGIACACRSLAQAGLHTGAPGMERLRRMAAGVAVELALRRHLEQQGVPFDVLGSAPFSDRDHYDVSLGGHRVDVRSTLVSRRRLIDLLHQERAQLLQAPALIPMSEFTAQEGKPEDIQLFAFLPGLVAASRQDADQAQAAGQPVCLVHPLPVEWSRPSPWVPLEGVALKSECDQGVCLEVCGQDAGRNFITRALDLPPRTRTALDGGFHSLTCLRVRRRPEARIGIHCPQRGEAHIISPFEWGNLWVYGSEVLLAGWLTRENYRRKATVLNTGAPVLLTGRTREKNLLVPVGDLNPLTPLFHRVKTWAGNLA